MSPNSGARSATTFFVALSSATTVSTACTESAVDSRTAVASAVPGVAMKRVAGQITATDLSSMLWKRTSRALCANIWPDSKPKPPSPLAGTTCSK